MLSVCEYVSVYVLPSVQVTVVALRDAASSCLDDLARAINRERSSFIEHRAGRIVLAQDVAHFAELQAAVERVRSFCTSLAAVACRWDAECVLGCQTCLLCKDGNRVAPAHEAKQRLSLVDAAADGVQGLDSKAAAAAEAAVELLVSAAATFSFQLSKLRSVERAIRDVASWWRLADSGAAEVHMAFRCTCSAGSW